MEDLKLKIGAQINESEVDQSINRIKQKLKDIKRVEETGQLSPAAQNQQQSQSRVMQDLQKRYVDEITKKYENLQKLMTGLEKTYERQTTNEKGRLAIQEKMLELKKQEASISETLAKHGTTTATTTATQPQQNQQNQLLNAFKGLLSTVSVAAIVNGALNISQNMIRAEGRGVIQAGQAAQGAARPMYESTQGRGYEQFFFAEERAEAARGAMEQSGRQRVQDRVQALNPFGGAANFGGMMGGAAVGAKLGAGIGAGFGMGFGAVPGAAIGGVLGGAAGLLAGSSTNERSRLSLFDSDNYDKLITAEGMKDFEAREAAIKAQDPSKLLSQRYMQGNQAQAMQAQRTLGLEDQDMFGDQGFLSRNMGFGGQGTRFTQKDILSNMQALAQSGAQTADITGQDLSGLSAAARQAGISSAPKVLGRISGAGMQEQTTDEAFKKLMSEAVRVGVDASKMPIELNRFVELSSQLATRGGGFSEEATARFAAGITDFSQQGMAAAAGFAQEFQTLSKQGAGLEGQIGIGFLMGDESKGILGDEAFDKLSGDFAAMQTINQLSLEDIERDPALLRSASKELGVGENELKELIRRKDRQKQTISTGQEEALTKLSSEIQGKTGEDLESALGESGSYFRATTQQTISRAGFAQRGAQQRRAGIVGTARTLGDMEATMEGEIPDLAQPERIMEKGQRDRAIGDALNIQNFEKNIEKLSKAFDQFAEKPTLAAEAFQIFIEAAKTGGDALKNYTDAIRAAAEDMERNSNISPIRNLTPRKQ